MRDELRHALAVMLPALTLALRPAQAMTVSEWAEARRFVAAESGSPAPGKWRNELVPFLVEPMDLCGLDHPCRKVVVIGGAQSTKSEIGLNALGHTVECEPSPALVMLPSIDETRKYNRVKLDQMIAATPSLKALVRAEVSRDERGSTGEFKRFRGGFAQLVNAGSPKGLQMVSARLRIYEEVSGYPADTGGRGSPVAQADARGIAWEARGDKVVMISTPNIKGACRITAEWEASDQRRLYVPCPHCGAYQHLVLAGLRAGPDLEHAWYACAAHGCVIEQSERPRMVAAGAWIKTYPEGPDNPVPPAVFPPAELVRWRGRDSAGRHPGFHIWRVYSPFSLWGRILEALREADGKPYELKAFTQQTLGEAWEEQGEAPDAELLFERRQKWPTRRLVAGVLFTTGTVDVQGDRLEWAVYGWDRRLGGYTVDRGVLAGDPRTDAPWAKLAAEVMPQRYQDAWGRAWAVDVWGIDAGFLSQHVYRFVRPYAEGGKVKALDGRPGWKRPAIGSPTTVDHDWEGRKVGAVQLWPVGTWDLKSELYGKLRMTIDGPNKDGVWPAGCLWFDQSCDREYFAQLTAEYLADIERQSGYVDKAWRKINGRRNEQHDLAVYALALARHAEAVTPAAEWARIEAERLGPPDEAQLDLAGLWAPTLQTQVAGAPALRAPAAAEPTREPAAVLPFAPDRQPAGVNPVTGRAWGAWI